MRTVDAPPLTLASLARLLRAQGDGALRLCCPDPVLVVSPPGGAARGVDTPPEGIALPRSEETSALGEPVAPPEQIARLRRGPGPDALIKPVTKSDRNPFAGVITIGRAANNDVAIESPQVSKVHAWVRGPAGRLKLSDNASTNGTTIDGVQLAPKIDHALRPGAEVRFGPVECVFLDADGLIDLLAGL